MCAPSNVAVDHLTEKLHVAGVKVLRLQAKSREVIGSSVEQLSLHSMVQELASDELRKYAPVARLPRDPPRSPDAPRASRYHQLRERHGGLSHSDMHKFKKLQRRAEQELIKEADVICCTCVGAGVGASR